MAQNGLWPCARFSLEIEGLLVRLRLDFDNKRSFARLKSKVSNSAVHFLMRLGSFRLISRQFESYGRGPKTLNPSPTVRNSALTSNRIEKATQLLLLDTNNPVGLRQAGVSSMISYSICQGQYIGAEITGNHAK